MVSAAPLTEAGRAKLTPLDEQPHNL